jgi:hypothetical protein
VRALHRDKPKNVRAGTLELISRKDEIRRGVHHTLAGFAAAPLCRQLLSQLVEQQSSSPSGTRQETKRPHKGTFVSFGTPGEIDSNRLGAILGPARVDITPLD